MTPKAEFRHVRKSFDGRMEVIPDLNLQIRQGEFLTLLGPSGSGKTTTLMLLAGFEIPTQGEILLDGKSLHRLPPYRRNLGMVFQNYALFPHMTVAQNLAFPLEVRRRSRAEIRRRTTRALEIVRLAGYGDRKPGQLSGGQQQRVALARALVFDPSLVLMDEPLGALDKQLREELQFEIRHIHRELGVTLVYVTHDQGEALTMSDRIAVFQGGRIRQLAAPEDLYERPADAFVAGFIGENNRLAGTVVAQDERECRVALADGTRLQAPALTQGGVGQRVVVSIRPERLRLLPPEGGYENRFQGRVEEIVFIGDHLRIRLKAFGSDSLIVKIPNDIERPAIAPGATIAFGWRRQDCRALLDDAP
ncbi:polyamine-transporting ATPase [Hypericibacter adhaerens]|uniref:Spermidine/putrescine import ATP-binding protein PotA n=1 Tax=Hypericibacter adhaerens TaxID=2602016 RepID=A0A5J6N0Y4_9PROT|nr:ABC transporter ATP-binding protein [Hypericibacter adhaerens]QEX22220.1 polyamine-transporting ATPase [Hypericibacter adhaerens]